MEAFDLGAGAGAGAISSESGGGGFAARRRSSNFSHNNPFAELDGGEEEGSVREEGGEVKTAGASGPVIANPFSSAPGSSDPFAAVSGVCCAYYALCVRDCLYLNGLHVWFGFASAIKGLFAPCGALGAHATPNTRTQRVDNPVHKMHTNHMALCCTQASQPRIEWTQRCHSKHTKYTTYPVYTHPHTLGPQASATNSNPWAGSSDSVSMATARGGEAGASGRWCACACVCAGACVCMRVPACWYAFSTYVCVYACSCCSVHV